MVMIEGTLWKWTNYLSGWQPRWFVLDYGVLAYYRSQDETHLGSRGSMKMSCCEINVNANDPLRLDLKIPPENYMYLRASTSAERQQWLVALGTAKACLTDGTIPEQKQQFDAVMFLRDKMSELSTDRNILLKQVQAIKSKCTSDDGNKALNEAAVVLSATCNNFVLNLNEIMDVLEDNLSVVSGSPVSTPMMMNVPHSRRRNSPRNSSPCSSPSSSMLSASFGSNRELKLALENARGSQKHMEPPNSAANTAQIDSTAPNQTQSVAEPQTQGPIASSSPYHTQTNESERKHEQAVSPVSQGSSSVQSPADSLSEDSLAKDEKLTMFTLAPARFEHVGINQQNGIDTNSFLDACAAILPFFDALGSTTFSPVKMDIQGNIKKIRTKYSMDQRSFHLLQNMIQQEIKSGSCTAKNSVTDALLWLKRALEFMHTFLSEVYRGEQDLVVAATTAYNATLKRYHGWVVSGVFTLAVKAVPYRKDLMVSLGRHDNGISDESLVISEMGVCVKALGRIVAILNQFYRKHKLDSNATV